MKVIEEDPEKVRVELSKEEMKRLNYEMGGVEGSPPGGVRLGQVLREQINIVLDRMNGNYE